nr:FkbM family methyltransferase [Acidocella aromatica]
MEHFIERLKKRPQFQEVPNLWAAYDVRDEEDTAPQALAGPLLAGIEALRAPRFVPNAVPPENRLIFDIGMAEGDDTALYLAKGFRVVGLEPSAKTYYGLCERFVAEIKAGRLTVLNYAAGRETGQILEFFHNDKHPRLSGFSAGRPEFASGYTSYHVVTIGWAELVAQYGVPHYAKIDIEGAEVAFLAGAEGAALPAYISVECHDLGPAEALHKLGYRRFQLSDQNPPGGYAWPDPAREGRKAEGVDVNHTSGPFGAELPPDWLDFEMFRTAWRAAKAQGKPTWYDCHAALV